ncbi:hypothetical protein BDZ89DRAFT_1143908 [Hymenopellis radicata]|nr:hypothetical protein BDZ89DRAFT_1143908 [Hymenopellis radicata]
MSMESAVDIFLHIRATRYLNAAGLVPLILAFKQVLLYDHLLLLGEEVRYLWASRWTLQKALFLWIRYAVPICVIIHTHQLAGIGNSELTDKVSALERVFIVFDPITATTACSKQFASVIPRTDLCCVWELYATKPPDLLVLLHLWNLWDRDRRMMYATLSLFVLTFIGNMACTAVTIVSLNETLHFNRQLGLCAILDRGRTPLLWAPSIAFDIVTLVCVVYSALERPRSAQTAVTRVLYRDGIVYLLLLFLLRLVNLFLSIFAPVSLIFIGVFFIWCSTTVTVTRFTLNLMRMEAREKARRQALFLELEEL